ncbi:hypothetical protein GPJ56_002504 [Histomonas meleagridis]|uniref:uncharacterized protein n=1 Tax=Histomonas meleagridis TaxID=135588 RepID=UPI003559EF63|nr:hypothetical protein GPJ56_002504 [Histomonas meleagridis]KAH0806032.1 hypothetical protein GO595_001193 [Histomonas meleagridis]
MSQLTKEEEQKILKETPKMLESYGVSNQMKAQFIQHIANEVVGSDNPYFFSMQPKIKTRNTNKAWMKAYALVMNYLKENNLILTSQTIDCEFKQTKTQNPKGSLRDFNSSSDQFSDLLEYVPTDTEAEFQNKVKDFVLRSEHEIPKITKDKNIISLDKNNENGAFLTQALTLPQKEEEDEKERKMESSSSKGKEENFELEIDDKFLSSNKEENNFELNNDKSKDTNEEDLDLDIDDEFISSDKDKPKKEVHKEEEENFEIEIDENEFSAEKSKDQKDDDDLDIDIDNSFLSSDKDKPQKEVHKEEEENFEIDINEKTISDNKENNKKEEEDNFEIDIDDNFLSSDKEKQEKEDDKKEDESSVSDFFDRFEDFDVELSNDEDQVNEGNSVGVDEDVLDFNDEDGEDDLVQENQNSETQNESKSSQKQSSFHIDDSMNFSSDQFNIDIGDSDE